MNSKLFRLNGFRIGLVLVSLFSFVFAGCDNDESIGTPEKLKPDTRLVGKDRITISHVNPATGVDYTAAELAALDYKPEEEEFYLPLQPINLTLNMQAKPAKVEIEVDGNPNVIATFDTFTNNNGVYSTTWSTNLEELNIPEGGNVKYVFHITYDNLGKDGFKYASTGKTVFRVHHSAAGAASAIVFLKKAVGSKKIIEYSGNGLLPNIDANQGAFLDFNGTSQFASISEKDENLDFTHNEDFSVSFWINTTDNTSDPSIIGDKDWGSGGNKGFVVAYKGGTWKVNVGDGSNRVDIDGPAVGDGKWHHIAITFDRDGMMTLYQDAVKVGEKDMSTIGDMNSELPINIAQDGTGKYGNFYKGKLGSVTLSKYVLSEGEIAVQARKNTGVQLRQGNKITVIDVDNNGVTPTREGTTLTRDFKASNFSKLNDTQGVLNFRHGNDFSVAFWVKTTADNSDPSMLGDKDWGSGGNKGFVFSFLGSKWKVNIGDGGGNRADATAEKSINDGEWHLLGATFDRDGDMTLYQDGEAVASTSIAVIGDMNSAMPVHIAQDGTGTYGSDFAGQFKNIYFYDKVLSADEMNALFKE